MVWGWGRPQGSLPGCDSSQSLTRQPWGQAEAWKGVQEIMPPLSQAPRRSQGNGAGEIPDPPGAGSRLGEEGIERGRCRSGLEFQALLGHRMQSLGLSINCWVSHGAKADPTASKPAHHRQRGDPRQVPELLWASSPAARNEGGSPPQPPRGYGDRAEMEDTRGPCGLRPPLVLRSLVCHLQLTPLCHIPEVDDSKSTCL